MAKISYNPTSMSERVKNYPQPPEYPEQPEQSEQPYIVGLIMQLNKLNKRGDFFLNNTGEVIIKRPEVQSILKAIWDACSVLLPSDVHTGAITLSVEAKRLAELKLVSLKAKGRTHNATSARKVDANKKAKSEKKLLLTIYL